MERSPISQSIILVTGGYGLLGSRVVPFLAQHIPGCRLLVVGRNKQERRRSDHPNIEVLHGDLRDERLWATLPVSITHVCHLAARIPWKAEEKLKACLVTDNLLPIAHLIESSQRWPNLRQIIYSSSVSVYAQTKEFLREDSLCQPTNLYGGAKLAGEELLGCVESRGVCTVSLRLSSLYSAGQYEGTVLPIMIRRVLHEQELLIFGDGARTQDYLHCEDAARAILLCFQKEARGIYNIGYGEPTTMTELAHSISRVFAAGGAKIVYQTEKADGDPGIKLDISKARRELDYQPTISLETGLRKLKQEMEERAG